MQPGSFVSLQVPAPKPSSPEPVTLDGTRPAVAIYYLLVAASAAALTITSATIHALTWTSCTSLLVEAGKQKRLSLVNDINPHPRRPPAHAITCNPHTSTRTRTRTYPRHAGPQSAGVGQRCRVRLRLSCCQTDSIRTHTYYIHTYRTYIHNTT